MRSIGSPNWLGAQRSGFCDPKAAGEGPCDEYPSQIVSLRTAPTVSTSSSAATP